MGPQAEAWAKFSRLFGPSELRALPMPSLRSRALRRVSRTFPCLPCVPVGSDAFPYVLMPSLRSHAFSVSPFSPVGAPGGLSKFAAQIGCEQRLSQ